MLGLIELVEVVAYGPWCPLDKHNNTTRLHRRISNRENSCSTGGGGFAL